MTTIASFRAVNNNTIVFKFDFTSLGIKIGFLPILDILIYQILNKTSPPIPNLLAVLFDNTPFDVDNIETPRPSRTLGISLYPTKTLLPGLLTRSIPEITDLPSWLYFRKILIDFFLPSLIKIKSSIIFQTLIQKQFFSKN